MVQKNHCYQKVILFKIFKIEDLDDLENVENLEELEKLGVDLEKILEQNHIQIVGDGIDYCETPFMGIYFGNLSLEKANELSFNKEYGVLINGVVENSPAKFYRLLKDDIIMAVDDKQVKNENAITKIISSYYVGDKVKLSIFRDGEMKDVAPKEKRGFSNKVSCNPAINRKGVSAATSPSSRKKPKSKINSCILRERK